MRLEAFDVVLAVLIVTGACWSILYTDAREAEEIAKHSLFWAEQDEILARLIVSNKRIRQEINDEFERLVSELESR